MGRDDGFAIADIAVGHLDDDKVRKLWRLLAPDSAAMSEALMLHLAAVLASWGSGRRVTLDEAAPLWLPVDERLAGLLVDVGLLDRSRKVPSRSFTRWYGPAAARREARKAAGSLGGKAKAKRTSSDARASLYPSGRQAGPSVPSESDRPKRARREPSTGSPRGGEPTKLRDALAAAGGFAADLVAKNGGDR